ncbi:tRNA (uracil(54)-C5)-methyltransferase [hydrothermal vent metagenome]|uniref:tRNA (Uracil(54)-C5)-methyltransferase n=1 Tax=hydrothermal vent metagenome TaxID=652676 RepID=A0A1W1BPC1_9ZZZZ
MECKYFGVCGSCRVYEGGYDAQLALKVEENKKRFAPFYSDEIEIFKSKEDHYRARAEFRIWHSGERIDYAMTSQEKEVVCIDECPQVNEYIAQLMPKLLSSIKSKKIDVKLFGCDFLSTTHGDMVVSLLYHKKLDEEWIERAQKVANELQIDIIGRSRKQKIVIGKDYVIEKLSINGREFAYKHIENSFTQPNPYINQKMIEWTLKGVEEQKDDLLELYCGAGNFTIPFATKFQKVLATEISKSSIAAAKENMQLNGVENIEFVRMSVEEFTDALDGVREFNRMRHIDIKSYNFSSVFVDPPRAGMDEKSCRFVSRFENIIYISCNPQTLLRDIEILSKTHEVQQMALFDQFPYTHHVEMGAKLRRKR